MKLEQAPVVKGVQVQASGFPAVSCVIRVLCFMRVVVLQVLSSALYPLSL